MEIPVAQSEPPPWKTYTLYKGEIQEPFFNLLSLQKFPNIEQLYLEELRQSIAEYDKNPLFLNDNWEYYKKIVNPYELVYTQSKYANFPQSICILRPLSRSYFKMVELLEVFKFFDNISSYEKSRGIRSAHACEGPGGFIEALFDLAEKNRAKIIQSTAITLRPLLPNVPGWKRATNFLSRNKNIKIVYGEDRTGDILQIKNQQSFIKEVEGDNNTKVNIYTADGGLDFSDDYLHQEDKIFPLLLASAKLGLAVLKKDGMMIMKFFDIQTTQLIYFIQYFFKKWTLYKPSVSRPCNPEQYFIGIGFKGCKKEHLDKLDRWHSEDYSFNMFEQGMDSSFLNNIFSIQMNLINYQIKYLKQIFEIITKMRYEFKTTGKTEIMSNVISNTLNRNLLKCIDWCREFSVPIRQGVISSS